MNAKTAKLLRRHAAISGQNYRASKRLWNRWPKSARGKAREQLRAELAREMARLGGQSGTGAAKRRPRAHYVRAGKLSAAQKALKQKLTAKWRKRDKAIRSKFDKLFEGQPPYNH